MMIGLPDGVSWPLLHGCAWLGAIGFTMSLFITALAFQDDASIQAAKIATLGASLAAGVIGAVVLTRAACQRQVPS